jgi:hypothetical protein
LVEVKEGNMEAPVLSTQKHDDGHCTIQDENRAATTVQTDIFSPEEVGCKINNKLQKLSTTEDKHRRRNFDGNVHLSFDKISPLPFKRETNLAFN